MSKKIISNLVWIVGSQILLLISNLLLLKLFTNKLTIDEFSLYSLLMSILVFLRQVTFDSFSMVVGKKSASYSGDKENISHYFQVVRYATDRMAIFIFCCGVLFAVSSGLLGLNYLISIIVFWGAIYLLSNGAQGIYLNVLNSVDERASAAKFSTLDAILKLILSTAAFMYLKIDLLIAFQAVSVGAFLTFFYTRYFIKNQFFESEINEKVKTEVVASFVLCIPLLFSSALNAFKGVGDRWLLTAFLGLKELGAYTVLLQIGYLPIILIFGVIQTYLGPEIYKLCADNSRQNRIRIKKIIIGLICFSVGCSVLLGLISFYLSEWIFGVLVSADYSEYSKYLPFFVTAGVFAACAGIFQLVVFGLYDTRGASILIVLSISLGLLLISFLIYIFGFLGAVVGLSLVSMVSMLVFAIAINKRLFVFA